MKTQLDFIRTTRALERETVELEKAYMLFISETLQKDTDLSTAEKYTLLTAFVDELAGDGGMFDYIFEKAESDKTAMRLTSAYERITISFGIAEKRADIHQRMAANNKAFSEWNQANSPKSPLLPN